MTHTPQRLEGESQRDYRVRQQASKRAARIVAKGQPRPHHEPMVLHANPEKNVRRRLIALHGGFRQFRKITRAAKV